MRFSVLPKEMRKVAGKDDWRFRPHEQPKATQVVHIGGRPHQYELLLMSVLVRPPALCGEPVYRLEAFGGWWSCTCNDWHHARDCVHIRHIPGEYLRRLEAQLRGLNLVKLDNGWARRKYKPWMNYAHSR